MKNILGSVLVFSVVALLSSCGHMSKDHGASCQCTSVKEKCDCGMKKTSSDGKSAECEDCKKGN